MDNSEQHVLLRTIDVSGAVGRDSGGRVDRVEEDLETQSERTSQSVLVASSS